MHVTELSAALQTALLKKVVGISVRCILDPDDVNLDISDRLDIDAPVNIQKSLSIIPYGEAGRYQISEVTLRLINKSDYFNHTKSTSPFYYVNTRIINAKGSADAFVKVLKGEGSKFSSITSVTLGQGTSAVNFTISSIDTADPNFDKINFTASGSVAFSVGTVLESRYLPGRKVVLKTIVNAESEEITQFNGILKSHPTIDAQFAEITLYDPLKSLLDVDLKATSARILNETVFNTVEYKRAGSSTGTIDNSKISVSGKCPIGKWKITFTDGSGNYTIRAPNNDTQTGSLVTLLFFPTLPAGGTAWVQIPNTAWTGTFDKDDEITFTTQMALGVPLLSAHKTIPQMIYNLIINTDFGAGIPTADVDVTVFTELINYYDEMVGAFSVTKPTTVLKAIEILQRHINGALFSKNDGKITIFAYRPRYDDGTSFPTLSPDTDISEIDITDLGRIDAVSAQWHYSHADSKYQRIVFIPDQDTKAINPLELKLPATYIEAVARSAAERAWIMWRKGVRAYKIIEKFNYGVAWELGDIFKVSSDHPSLAERVVVIYELRKDLRNGTVTARGYDLNYAFSNFLVLDVLHKLDTGKVIW